MAEDCAQSKTEDCSPWIQEVEWDLIHEDAVMRYLEWGNNNFLDDLRRPVTLSGEYSIYFVVDSWGPEPKVVLTKMNNYGSQALCEKRLPKELADMFYKRFGNIKGIHEPTPEIKEWLRSLYKEKL